MVTTDFTNFDLLEIRRVPTVLNRMCGSLLTEIASYANFSELDALVRRPTFALLKLLVGEVAPNKLLRTNDNINGVNQETLVDWVDASGLMMPVNRSFFSPDIVVPETFGVTIITTGTGNWMMRKMSKTLTLDPHTPVLSIGSGRVMKPGEHQAVKTFYRKYGKYPTEGVFMSDYIVRTLMGPFGFDHVKSYSSETTDGDTLYDEAFERHKEYLNGTVRVIAIAPNAMQNAGQIRGSLRRTAQRIGMPSFDAQGDQVFVECDPFPVGPVGNEPPAQYQGATSAVGQILRAYLLLAQEAEGILPS